MKKYEAFIFYKMDENHKDIEYVGDWHKGKVYYYHDTYTFTDDYVDYVDYQYEYMKHDLSLIAGGGYSKKHIHDVSFTILETV